MAKGLISDRLEVRSLKPRRPNGMPPVLFMHGAFAGAWCWAEHFFPWFFDQGYEVHAFSFTGHGDSEAHTPLHHLSIRDYMADALEIIDALDSPPIIIAHSMGGFVAQKLLGQRDIAALVLMASVPPTGLMAPAWTMAAFKPSVFWQIGILQTFGEDFADTDAVKGALFGPTVSDDLASRYAPYIQVESHRAVMDMYGPEITLMPAVGRCPVQVLGAEHDVMVAPPFVHATAAIHGVSAQIVAEMGHGMMLEPQWEGVAQTIDVWLHRQDGLLSTQNKKAAE